MKKVFDQPPYSILGLHLITGTFLLLNGIFEVFFWRQLIAHGVQKFQREISYHPEKGWEIFSYFFGI
jgi:hypothetical protein